MLQYVINILVVSYFNQKLLVTIRRRDYEKQLKVSCELFDLK